MHEIVHIYTYVFTFYALYIIVCVINFMHYVLDVLIMNMQIYISVYGVCIYTYLKYPCKCIIYAQNTTYMYICV